MAGGARRPLPTARRWLIRLLLVLLVAPAVLIFAYRYVNPPLTPLMVIRLAEGNGIDKDWTSLAGISPHLAHAVIAAEDNLFCRHMGFDMEALGRQLEKWRAGERPRGASTITMQTAKNVLLWPGRDPVRKVIEAWLTPQIELLWSKRRILEVYLNVAEFGPGIYGAEAAARAFFARAASELSRGQAARLAAVLPNPRQWSAGNPGPYVRRRAAALQRRMGQLGPLLDCADAARLRGPSSASYA